MLTLIALLSVGAFPLNEKIAPCTPPSLHHLPLPLFHSRFEKSATCPSAGSMNGAAQFSGAIRRRT